MFLRLSAQSSFPSNSLPSNEKKKKQQKLWEEKYKTTFMQIFLVLWYRLALFKQRRAWADVRIPPGTH